MQRKTVGSGSAGFVNSNTSKRLKQHRNVDSSSRLSYKILLLLVIISFLIGIICYQTNIISQKDEAYRVEKREHESQIHSLEESEEVIKKQIEEYQEQVASHQKEVSKAGTNSVQSEKKQKGLETKLSTVTKQFEHLVSEVKNKDRQAVVDKFGDGPTYQVEFQLDFPPDEIPAGTADKFIVETAPLDKMPHTVHFFLEQVSRNLYDGCSFHRNAGHVVQGGPVTYYKNEGAQPRKLFVESGLTSVSFQEYSADFPHVKYTLGFAGRPGGPDFYVSVKDNSIAHCPGGQTSYELASEADPCFAKVIEGFDAVDRIHVMSRKPGGYMAMKHHVGIVHAKIIGWEPLTSKSA